MRKFKDFGLEIKQLEEAGTFEGYASVFGIVDSGNDVVEPGAFAVSLVKHRREGTMPLMLWQHDPDEPIGTWEDIAEDGKGLYVKGTLLKGVQVAEEAYIRLKAKAVRGLSFAYDTIDSETDGNVRRLKELDIPEISIVSFPMNRRARVDLVKSDDDDRAIKFWKRFEGMARKFRDGEPMPAKEFEEVLREAGYPRSMAVQIASVGYAKAIRSESEGGEATTKAVSDAIASLRSIVPAT